MLIEDLTRKQARLFEFLLEYAREQGVFPSFQTIIDETWINSKNGVHQYFQSLVSKDYLQQEERGSYRLHPAKRYLLDSPGNPIPIKGTIAAGSLREAIASDLGSLSIRDLFPRAKSPYCLRVSGNSMAEVGIADGDLVILDDRELTSGDIGAVLYNGETTLKEVHIGDRQVVLSPKSREHSPIVIRPDEFEEIRVLGRYLAHFRDGRIRYID